MVEKERRNTMIIGTNFAPYDYGTTLEACRSYLPTSDLRLMKSIGITGGRIIVNVNNASTKDGELNFEYLDGLLDFARRCSAIGMTVIWCPFGGNSHLLPDPGFDVFGEMSAGDPGRLLNWWGKMAAHIAGDPGLPAARVKLALANEPQVSLAAWKELQSGLHSVVRAAAPAHRIVLNFGGWCGIAQLLDYGAPTVPDPNTEWEVHEYSPWWIFREGDNRPVNYTYHWPMSVQELKDRYLETSDDPVLADKRKSQAAATSQFDKDWWETDIQNYAMNQVQYDAYGLNGRVFLQPFDLSGLTALLENVRHWRAKYGRRVSITEFNGGYLDKWRKDEASWRTLLRLEADKSKVYRAMGFDRYLWHHRGLFKADTGGHRIVDTERLAAIMHGLAA